VRGRPFIEYQPETLCAAGVRDVLLLVSYLGDVVERYVGRGTRCGVNVRYSSESIPLGVGAMWKSQRDSTTSAPRRLAEFERTIGDDHRAHGSWSQSWR
jgi:NDP-sugar pyrophosphorylase family protein